jgi:hypothetical protein
MTRIVVSIACAAIRDLTVSDGFRWSAFLGNGHHAREHGDMLTAVNAPLRSDPSRGLRALTALSRGARLAFA